LGSLVWRVNLRIVKNQFGGLLSGGLVSGIRYNPLRVAWFLSFHDRFKLHSARTVLFAQPSAAVVPHKANDSVMYAI